MKARLPLFGAGVKGLSIHTGWRPAIHPAPQRNAQMVETSQTEIVTLGRHRRKRVGCGGGVLTRPCHTVTTTCLRPCFLAERSLVEGIAVPETSDQCSQP